MLTYAAVCCRIWQVVLRVADWPLAPEDAEEVTLLAAWRMLAYAHEY